MTLSRCASRKNFLRRIHASMHVRIDRREHYAKGHVAPGSVFGTIWITDSHVHKPAMSKFILCTKW